MSARLSAPHRGEPGSGVGAVKDPHPGPVRALTCSYVRRLCPAELDDGRVRWHVPDPLLAQRDGVWPSWMSRLFPGWRMRGWCGRNCSARFWRRRPMRYGRDDRS